MTTRPSCLIANQNAENKHFENKKHEVYTVNKYKIALNRDDYERIAQADGITKFARGHVAISA